MGSEQQRPRAEGQWVGLGSALGACFALSPPRSPSQPPRRRAMVQGEEVAGGCPQAPVTQ